MPATVKVGTALIVGDADLEDRYVADLMKQQGKDLYTLNPIVQVRFILRYPIQHAIIWKDVVCENRPIQEGVICRLNFFSVATTEEVNRFRTYEESLKAAQEDALQRAYQTGDNRTAEIILRHMRGEYNQKPRVLIALKRWEI